ncbi:hypothetical protein JTB14_029518 [Gonioctena quinquepunctata]|nr:hypothetical protein JTB14_029518 [Gonioctena quinquepunctata]
MSKGADVALLVKELNKLKKDELVDLMIKKQLPSDRNSALLTEFVTKMYSAEVTEQISDTTHPSPDAVCDKVVCTKISADFETLKKLTYHLEKRTQEQEDLILLLKEKCNFLRDNTNINDTQPSVEKS